MSLGLPAVPVLGMGGDGGGPQGWRCAAGLRGWCADDAQRVHNARLGDRRLRRLHVHQVFEFFVVARSCRVGGAGEAVPAVLHEVLFGVAVLLFGVQGDVVLVVLELSFTVR